MNEKALNTLEYNKIIGMLTSKAISQMGKERATQLKPSSELSDILHWQKETSEAVSIILKKGSLPLGGIKDVRASVKHALVGGVLGIEPLMHVADFLHVCKKVVSYSKSEGKNDSFPILEPHFQSIETVPSLEKEITRCIINENELADDASQALYSIRKNIKVSNDRVRDALTGIIHSQSYKTMLQDNVVTMRNGRYCIPVKQEYKNAFPGMVHDQSSTGATVFMEPMGVVTLNNKIKELLADEQKEIEKILRKLSAEVAEHGELILANCETLTYLDFVFAKGELGLSMNGSEPIFNENGFINIKKGRHPLIDPKAVVPTDIYLGKDFTSLLITGPNTGGKTVSLKTIGLFTLMGQAGLHIAANDRSELAVFDEVFADIGDEQSIEQSLSTFSSHMSNIVKILDKVTCGSLVLLDELGAGTDPTEGAALAIAILEYLHKLKVRTVVTTHYSELKVYALSNDGFENAACEFDVNTLRPTYRLLIGIPGKSNAFAISEKLGLPDYIISSAKDILSHEDARFEDIITDLEISRKTLIVEQEKAEQYRLESERLHKDLEQQKQKLKSQRDKIIAEAKAEARKLMQSTKDEADTMLKDFQKQLREQGNTKATEETRQKMRDKLSTLDADAASSEFDKSMRSPITKPLIVGDKVFVNTLNQSGTVVSEPTSTGEVFVTVGAMKIKVKLASLSMDDSPQEKKAYKPKGQSHSVKADKSKFISPEIDLRGCMVEEGLEKVDKYLDDAYLASLAQVTLIHGKGTGALRAAVQSHLKGHSHVKAFRLGAFGEGETGVTIVELK